MSQDNDNKIKLLEKIKSLFKKLKESVSNAVLFSIYGNSVLAKLDDLEDKMLEAAENDEITQRSIDKLTETVGGISGILKNLTKEDVSRVRDEVDKFVQECQNSLINKDQFIHFNYEGFYQELYMIFVNMFNENPNLNPPFAVMDYYEFADYFVKNFELYDIGCFGDETTTEPTEALGKLGDFYLKVKLTREEGIWRFQYFPLDEETAAQMKEKGNLIPLKGGESPDELITRSFFTPKGIYTEQTYKDSETYKKLKAKHPEIARNAELLYDCEDKVKLSDDGHIETYYDSQKNEFYIRDIETGDMLCYSMNNNEVNMKFYTGTDCIGEYGNKEKMVTDETNRFISDLSKGITRYCLNFTDFGKSGLFYRPESLDFLKSKGLDTKALTKMLEEKSSGKAEAERNVTKKGWYNVRSNALPKINTLKDYLNQAQLRFDTKYHITCDVKKLKFDKDTSVVYLTAEDPKTGNAMSFSFSKAGEPLTINYREGKNGKFTFMLDCLNGARGAESIKNLQSNEDFREMIAVFENAYHLYVNEQQLTAARDYVQESDNDKGNDEFTMNEGSSESKDYAFFDFD